MGSPRLFVAHPDGAFAFEHDLRRPGMGDDAKIRSLHRRLQIGVGRRPAHAVLDRHVEAAEAFREFAVEIGAHGIARLPAGLDEGVVQRIAPRAAPRRQRAVGAAIGVGARAPALRALEIRQHVAIRPTARALLLPAVEIQRMADGI